MTRFDPDPVIAAWQQMDIEDHPVAPLRVALVAFQGTSGLSPAERAHLLEGRCEQCEQVLLEAWRPHGPPALLLDALPDLPADGALATALRQRIAQHGAAAAAVEAEDVQAESRARVAETLARLPSAVAARVREWAAILVYENVPRPALAQAPGAGAERRKLAPGVTARPEPDGEGTVVRLSPSLLGELAGRELLLVLHSADGAILAEATVAPFDEPHDVVVAAPWQMTRRDGTGVVLAAR